MLVSTVEGVELGPVLGKALAEALLRFFEERGDKPSKFVYTAEGSKVQHWLCGSKVCVLLSETEGVLTDCSDVDAPCRREGGKCICEYEVGEDGLVELFSSFEEGEDIDLEVLGIKISVSPETVSSAGEVLSTARYRTRRD